MCGPYFNKDFLKQQWEDAAKNLRGYHIHIYFDKDDAMSEFAAQELADKLEMLFEDDVKGVHRVKEVGPHTKHNVEVDATKEGFGEIVAWLQLNNEAGLSILIHPETGDLRGDHHEAAMWIGKPVEMNEDFFDRADAQKKKAANGNGPRR